MPRATTILKDFSFVGGAVRDHKRAYLLAVQDDLAEKREPHGAFFTWVDGRWGQENVQWAAVSLCVARTPKHQMIAVGEYGDVLVAGSGELYHEEIKVGRLLPETRGTLRCVRAIDGIPYAAGMDRQVYRRVGPKKWMCIDASMRPKPGSRRVVGFESIDGFSEQDIYAVGWDGCIWHYNGVTWKEIESPTNLILAAVCCAGDGWVYASGQEGILLRGRDQRWEVLQHGHSQNLTSIAWYGGELFVSSEQLVYTLAKHKLKPATFGKDIPGTAYHLHSADGVLWSIGAKDIMAFNGRRWSRIA